MAPRDVRPQITFADAPVMPDPAFFSHVVSLDQTSRLVLTSGILGQRADGSFPQTFEEQANTAYSNLKATLARSGATARDIVKVTWFIVDWSYPDMGQPLIERYLRFVTDEYGTTHRPTTTLVPVTQLAVPDAKIEIEAVAAVGGHASPYMGIAARSSERQVAPIEVDVVVVGGGFSGLQTAWDIQKAGLSCVVLEAKQRIGGRSRSQKLQSGPGIVELGATWINKTTQPIVYATAKRLGLEMVEQYTEGDEVYQLRDGTVIRTTPGTAATEHLMTMSMTVGMAIDSELDKFNIHKVEDFPTAQDVSMEAWAESKGIIDPNGKAILKLFAGAVVGRDPEEIGMHYFLDYIKSGGGYISIASEGEAGAQSLKIKQGTSAIATGLADELAPGSIYLNSPVDNIHQTDKGAVVQTSTGTTLSCRKVVVAVPTNTYAKINFSPPLPRGKSALVSRTKPGVYAKMILTYRRAWWKDYGFQGKFSSLIGPICFSWEISDASTNQYSLAIFIAGEVAMRWAQLNELQRIENVLEHLKELVGEPSIAALVDDVLEVNYVNWSAEEYLYGAPTSVMGPGVLSKYGKALRDPFQHIHFAGGETAFEWKGYLEGALLAGSRAANEVVTLLPRVEKST